MLAFEEELKKIQFLLNGWLVKYLSNLEATKAEVSEQHFLFTFPPLPLSFLSSLSWPDPRVHPAFAEASEWRWIPTVCQGFDGATPQKRKACAPAPAADEVSQWDFNAANCGWVSGLRPWKPIVAACIVPGDLL